MFVLENQPDVVENTKEHIDTLRCVWCDAQAVNYLHNVPFCAKCHKKFEILFPTGNNNDSPR